MSSFMFSLRRKLELSYGLLILIILVVSGWNLYHLARLGPAIDIILVNNYKSISAANNMLDALERQRAATLLSMTGRRKEGRSRFDEEAVRYSKEFERAATNITELGEDKIIADMKAQYSAYKLSAEKLLESVEASQTDELSQQYFDKVETSFAALRKSLEDLLNLNQQAMLRANEQASSAALRAEASNALSAVAALIIALVFSWRFARYVAEPISQLTEKAKRIGEGDLDQYIQIASKDEIGALAMEFNRMVSRLRDLRQSDYWKLIMERKKSDAAIDSLYEPVIVTDAHGRITKLNRSAMRIFDSRRKEADEEISFSDLGADDRIARAVRSAIALHRPVDAEGEAALVPVMVEGLERDYRLRTMPMRDADGRLLGAVSVFEDVTSIREVDRVKTEFIKVASSKMRAPLLSLQTALYALTQKYSAGLNETQSDLAYAARSDAEKLDELMSDLLELSEIESGAKTLSPMPLRPADLMRSAAERHRSSFDSKDINLEMNIPPDIGRVLADEEAIKRIFDNLLSNALRHTDRNGTITISAEELEDRIVFSVSDTGEGIAEEHLPTIFSRFVHSREKSGGTGLGLAIVKKLAEEQGGQVGARSRLGEGTTFTFALPAIESVSREDRGSLQRQ